MRFISYKYWLLMMLVTTWNLTSCKKPEVSQQTLPTIGLTLAATIITDTTAQSGGFVVDPGGGPVIGRGLCLSTYQNPTVSDKKITCGVGVGPFNTLMKDLVPGTTYYVRAYAINEWGVAYGTQIRFTTLNPNAPTFATPTLVENPKQTSATALINVTTPGGSLVWERGACWSIYQNPNLKGPHIKDNGQGSGDFNIALTGLSPGTPYYLWGYAINSSGTFYSPPMRFKTPIASSPTVNAVVTNVQNNSATITLNIDDAGENGPLKFSGVCYSKNHIANKNDPTVTIIPLSPGVGTWSTDIQGLEAGTTYYLKPLVADSRSPIDTILDSTEVSFQTLGGKKLPVVVTLPPKITDQPTQTGILQAQITSYGDVPIVRKGFCFDNGRLNYNTYVLPPLLITNTISVDIFDQESTTGYFSVQAQNMCFPDGIISIRAYVVTENDDIIYGNWYCASYWGTGGCVIP